MKTIKIVGKNYCGQYTKERVACRGIVLKDNNMLLSYETLTDQWMIPGGGIDEGETYEECCIREIAEETGVLVNPLKCYLEIFEYYENYKYIDKYFICEAVGTTERKLTKREKEVGMEPRWIPFSEIKNIFSKHNDYASTNEMKRGMYFREYNALCELEEVKNDTSI